MAVAGAEVFATRSAAIQSSEGNNDGRIAPAGPGFFLRPADHVLNRRAATREAAMAAFAKSWRRPSMGNLHHRRKGSAISMRTTVLVLCLVALAAPSQAAQRTKASKAPDDLATRPQMCRAIVGREMPEATDGRSHEGQLNVQRFSDCLMGKLPGARPQ
jgi:hypothetical protein